MKNINATHAFSVELNNKEHLKTVAIPSSANSKVIIEGFLGKLASVCFVEDSMLEIQGTNGTIRIDIENEEFKKLIQTQAGKEVK